MGRENVFSQIFSHSLRIAEHKKESVITASIIAYTLIYVGFGLGGISFHSQPAIGYVQTTSNSACPAGSLWVDGGDLHWCDGSTEYYATNEPNDPITNHGSTSGPQGSIWVDGSNFYWIGGNGDKYSYSGQYESNPGATPGSVWVDQDDGYLRFIDESGEERSISY